MLIGVRTKMHLKFNFAKKRERVLSVSFTILCVTEMQFNLWTYARTIHVCMYEVRVSDAACQGTGHDFPQKRKYILT